MNKSLRYSLNTFINVVLTLGIIVFVVLLSKSHHKRFDLTEEKKFTLSEQTLGVLKNLEGEVTVEVFYTKGGNFLETANDLLDQYRLKTKKLKVVPMETHQHPVEARDYKLTQPDALVVKQKDRREVLSTADEQGLTNAILNVTREGKKTICFTTGHEERRLDGKEADQLFQADEDMQKEAYQVRTINLVNGEKIPADCTCIVIAGPRSDFFPKEMEQIRKFVDEGGSLMVMLEPWRSNKLLIEFLKEKGLQVENNIVIDLVSKAVGGQYLIPVVTQYGDHPIVKGFRPMTFFPMSRSVTIAKELPKDIDWMPLAQTSAPAPGSWGETDPPRKNAKFQYDKGRDIPGPISMGAAGVIKHPSATDDPAEKDRTSRLVVFGNVDFITNQFIFQQGNSNLFLNCLSWLTQQENLISIRPKNVRNMTLYLKDEDKKRIWFISVILLPMVVICAGIVINWLKR
jgi:ABC-type uncharacterized transport system involved in gliding motility auxiliary subunit